MADITIPLSKPYTVHDKTFASIKLREPRYREIFMEGRGKPREWQPSPHGPVIVSYPAVVDSYLQELIVEPGYECIGNLDVVDALALEKAVLDFFPM
ncbi:phage tail assembly protein [Ferirhizobium litorale]|uniref:Phage tail assembly protein n=1 Tax=Ferirhizobium litorale TaxID=2927786 RepID=A0AAE3U5L4_9HYPH|nr:phage tail assembly protein [Fererhizobium litorale]MDI7924598.1 phage tail assembly protein [Fererhizobium litorale]